MNTEFIIYIEDDDGNETEWVIIGDVSVGTDSDPTGYNYLTDNIIYTRYPVVDGFEFEKAIVDGNVITDWDNMPSEVQDKIDQYIEEHEDKFIKEAQEY